jgi:hypothetical protein
VYKLACPPFQLSLDYYDILLNCLKVVGNTLPTLRAELGGIAGRILYSFCPDFKFGILKSFSRLDIWFSKNI